MFVHMGHLIYHSAWEGVLSHFKLAGIDSSSEVFLLQIMHKNEFRAGRVENVQIG